MADQSRRTPSDEEIRRRRARRARSAQQTGNVQQRQAQPQPQQQPRQQQRRRPAHAAGAHSRPAGNVQKRPSQPRQRSAQGQSGRHAAQRPTPVREYSSRPPSRRRSPLPFIIGGLVVVFAVLVVVLISRSCSGGAGGGAAQAEGQATTTDGSTVEQAVDEGPQPVDINLAWVGDILFHYQVRESGLQADGTRNYDHVFANVLGELEGTDIAALDQETPLGGDTSPSGEHWEYTGYPVFNGPQEIGDSEVKAGFNVITKATNHAMDMGYEGITSELTFWREKHPEAAVVGEIDPTDESASINDVYVYEKDGFKVALLNYATDLNGMEDPQGVVSMLDEDYVRSTMATAREKADMIVVFPHWGEEYSTEPNEDQRAWAKTLVELGADIIIGNHPHIMQPVELLEASNGKTVPCFWSSGNFVSTSPDSTSLIGGLIKATLRKDVDGTCSIVSSSLTPILTHLGLSTDMTVYPLRDWTSDLASTNMLDTEVNPDTDNTNLTTEFANNFCTELFGSDFDTEKEILELDLEGKKTGNMAGVLDGSALAESDEKTSLESGASSEGGTSSEEATSSEDTTSGDYSGYEESYDTTTTEEDYSTMEEAA